MPDWVSGAEVEAMKSKAKEQEVHEKAVKLKKAEAEKKKALLNAAHFTVGLGAPLKKKLRNGE